MKAVKHHAPSPSFAKIYFQWQRAKVITAAKKATLWLLIVASAGIIIVALAIGYHHTFTECLLHIRPVALRTMASANSSVVPGPFEVIRRSPITTGSSEYIPPLFSKSFEERITGGFYPVDDTERTKHQSRSGAYSGDVASFFPMGFHKFAQLFVRFTASSDLSAPGNMSQSIRSGTNRKHSCRQR